jgi:predicted acylesterase/phospholipase RssA
LASVAGAPLASLALISSAPGGAVLRRTLLRRIPTGRRSLAQLGRMVEQAGVSWDGRLRIAAVDLASGRRVVFGSPRAPDVSVAQAVQASCAIPGVFQPLEADGRRYVDGGAWSPTNMDAVEVSSGDRVLCLNPTGSLRPSAGAPAGAFGPLSRGIARSARAHDQPGRRQRSRDGYQPDGRPAARAGGRGGYRPGPRRSDLGSRRRLLGGVEPRGMLALLLAVALIASTVLALLLAGVVAAIATGVGLLNVLALVTGLRSRRCRLGPSTPERWRPKSFRRLPAPPLEPEAEEHLHSRSLTVHRR